MGQGHPRGKKWDARVHKPCSKRPNDHIESSREEYTADPKRPNRLRSNNIIAGIAE